MASSSFSSSFSSFSTLPRDICHATCGLLFAHVPYSCLIYQQLNTHAFFDVIPDTSLRLTGGECNGGAPRISLAKPYPVERTCSGAQFFAHCMLPCPPPVQNDDNSLAPSAPLPSPLSLWPYALFVVLGPRFLLCVWYLSSA